MGGVAVEDQTEQNVQLHQYFIPELERLTVIPISNSPQPNSVTSKGCWSMTLLGVAKVSCSSNVTYGVLK